MDALSSISSSIAAAASRSWYERPAIAIACMIACPILTSVVYVIDKLAIARRVQYTSSYIALVGFFDFFLGGVLAFATKWNTLEVSGRDFLWPVLAGLMFGIATMFYIFALEGADVSRVVGLENTYPILVTILSIIVMHEVLGFISYIGVGITILGAVLLSVDVGPLMHRFIVKHVLHREMPQSPQEAAAAKSAQQASQGQLAELSAVTVVKNDVPQSVCPSPALDTPRATSAAPEDVEMARAPSFDNTVPDTPRYGSDFIDGRQVSERPQDSSAAPSKTTTPANEGEDDGDDMDSEQPRPSTDTQAEEGIVKPEDKLPKREERSKLGTMLLIIPLVVSLGVSEFFTKMSTDALPPFAVSAISYATYGLVMSTLVVLPDVRKHFWHELKRNWAWPILSESFMIGSNLTLAIAMSTLAAPVVSSVAASAPLFVLILEFALRMANDTWFTFCAYKLTPVAVTVIGVCLLSVESA